MEENTLIENLLEQARSVDVTQDESIPPKAIVQFESGMRLMVDERMKWEKVADSS